MQKLIYLGSCALIVWLRHESADLSGTLNGLRLCHGDTPSVLVGQVGLSLTINGHLDVRVFRLERVAPYFTMAELHSQVRIGITHVSGPLKEN